jgi:predicted ATPase
VPIRIMGESASDLSTPARNSFVGRERELAELVSACASPADTDANLFLISGEPGIGKTRLASELASRAKARGMIVLWGRCWEGDGAPAYWPWIQVIRSYLDALDPEQRKLILEAEVAADTIHEVAQIVPDLRHAQPGRRPAAADNPDPSEARFHLFDAVTSFLKIGARSRPMLIVLDDIHDADKASLALLRVMVRELKGAGIIVLATYRDLEMRQSPELSKLVGELSRDAHSIPLSSLSRSEVARFVQLTAGQVPDEMLLEKLCDATNGNPLFVEGIVRSLIAEGGIGSTGAPYRAFKVPNGLREAIRSRLNTLSPKSNSILTVASTIGNEFEFKLCQNAAEVSADEAHRLLDEASDAGIVTALGQGRYRFSHALICSAVYAELDSDARVRMHGTIADRLEEIYREDIDSRLAELAHHFREAGVTEKAIDYSVRAGRAATSVFAFTDAMMHLQAALELMEQAGSDALQRADLLFGLASCAFEVDRATSLRYGESAIALYESLGRFDQAAQVHILLGTIFHMRGEPLANAALATDHLRRAESAIAKEPESIPLANLYCVIASNESAKMNFGGSAIAAQRAMDIANRLSDKRHWPWAAVTYA